jgi:hypothetical protein
MPNTWSRGGKILLVIIMMSGLICVSVFSGGKASAAVAHTTTPNPTCGSDGRSLNVCIQAWSNGITFSYTGGNSGYNSQNIGYINANGYSPGFSKDLNCEGSTFSYFAPLTVGEWKANASIGVLSPGNVTYVNADLMVGGSNTIPAPPTSCVPQPSNTGTVNPPVVGMAPTSDGGGYWLVGANGSVQAFGDATWQGDLSGLALNKPIVGMAPTSDGKGYWLDASDGGIFSFGDAQFYGSMGGSHLNQPMVSMASVPDGHGYWMVAADGGIFSFGDAQFYGSMGGAQLNQPVHGMAVDMATGGYWLVASDGGIFSFNAPFHGSTGNLVLNKPIVEMEASPSGAGYRFVAADGGIFSFNLPFEGSLGNNPPADPIVGMSASGTNGYWVVEQNSNVHSFGNAPAV